jgi:hypothetical protein
MELKVIMHNRIGRPNADILLFCNVVDCHSSVFKITSLALSSFCAVVAVHVRVCVSVPTLGPSTQQIRMLQFISICQSIY